MAQPANSNGNSNYIHVGSSDGGRYRVCVNSQLGSGTTATVYRAQCYASNGVLVGEAAAKRLAVLTLDEVVRQWQKMLKSPDDEMQRAANALLPSNHGDEPAEVVVQRWRDLSRSQNCSDKEAAAALTPYQQNCSIQDFVANWKRLLTCENPRLRAAAELLVPSAQQVTQCWNDLLHNQNPKVAAVAANTVKRPLELMQQLVARRHAELNRELEVARMSSHRNVLGAIDLVQDAADGTCWIFMPIATRGTLADQLPVNDSGVLAPLAQETARYFFAQICCGLASLHANGVCHRDVKLENVLVMGDFGQPQETLRLCLADFGFANRNRGNLLSSCVGSPGYAAPEIATDPHFTKPTADFRMICDFVRAASQSPLCGTWTPVSMKNRYDGRVADVWSLGILLLQMLAGGGEKGNCPQQQFGDPHRKRDAIQRLPHELQDLFSRIFVDDPEKRCSMMDVLCHSWTGVATHAQQQQQQQQQQSALFAEASEAVEAARQITTHIDGARGRCQQISLVSVGINFHPVLFQPQDRKACVFDAVESVYLRLQELGYEATGIPEGQERGGWQFNGEELVGIDSDLLYMSRCNIETGCHIMLLIDTSRRQHHHQQQPEPNHNTYENCSVVVSVFYCSAGDRAATMARDDLHLLVYGLLCNSTQHGANWLAPQQLLHPNHPLFVFQQQQEQPQQLSSSPSSHEDEPACPEQQMDLICNCVPRRDRSNLCAGQPCGRVQIVFNVESLLRLGGPDEVYRGTLWRLQSAFAHFGYTVQLGGSSAETFLVAKNKRLKDGESVWNCVSVTLGRPPQGVFSEGGPEISHNYTAQLTMTTTFIVPSLSINRIDSEQLQQVSVENDLFCDEIRLVIALLQLSEGHVASVVVPPTFPPRCLAVRHLEELYSMLRGRQKIAAGNYFEIRGQIVAASKPAAAELIWQHLLQRGHNPSDNHTINLDAQRRVVAMAGAVFSSTRSITLSINNQYQNPVTLFSAHVSFDGPNGDAGPWQVSLQIKFAFCSRLPAAGVSQQEVNTHVHNLNEVLYIVAPLLLRETFAGNDVWFGFSDQ